MSGVYASYPFKGGGGSGVPTYANLASFPSGTAIGQLGVAQDTLILYAWTGSAWQVEAGPGSMMSIGTLDTGTPSANGAQDINNSLVLQSASTSNPGLVNTTTQSFLGQKTFSTGLTGTLTGAASLNVLTSALGNLTDAGTDGIIVTGGTGSVVGSVSLSQHVADTSHNGYLSSTDWNTFNGKQSLLTLTNLTDVGTDGITITNGTGAVIGASPVTISQRVADATHNGYLLSTDWSTFNGKQAAGSYITALTGDVAASGPGSVAATLATVNANVGSFGSSTSIPSFTVNGKGLITAASGNVVIAPAGTLSGTTLNATVVSSSLTSVGTIATGVWNGTTIAIANGGTGQTAKTAAFDALQPMTTGGDIIYGGASGTGTRLANGSAGQVLTSSGTTVAPTWATPTAAPGATYWSGYYPGSTSNYWSGNATGSYTDYTAVGTIPTPTVSQQNGFTVSKATSSQVGINFSAPRTGILHITFVLEFLPTQIAGSNSYSHQLLESTGFTTIALYAGNAGLATTAADTVCITLSGYLSVTASTTYNFKIQSVSAGAGTYYIGSSSAGSDSGACLNINMHYIT